ncbi:MAG: hypothetical protein NTY64_22865 [Deltaproteobacteria bacterium]|nr:hypothetical protein [Deltaproteobacteria bacterium]
MAKVIFMELKVLEIVGRVLTTFDHCSHCETIFDAAGVNSKFHKRDFEEYPQDLREEFSKLSDWIRELHCFYNQRLQIALIDAQSPAGILKSLRHFIREYPAFIMDRKKIYSGWDKNQLQEQLDKHLSMSQEKPKGDISSPK